MYTMSKLREDMEALLSEGLGPINALDSAAASIKSAMRDMQVSKVVSAAGRQQAQKEAKAALDSIAAIHKLLKRAYR